MNVVDSSGWLEYFSGGENADFFAKTIEATSELVVPTLSIYEVFQRVLQQRSEGDALKAIAAMQQGRVIDLTAAIALSAARISRDLELPMADSIMMASARAYDAEFWTQDSDFERVPGVRYVAKRRR